MCKRGQAHEALAGRKLAGALSTQRGRDIGLVYAWLLDLIGERFDCQQWCVIAAWYGVTLVARRWAVRGRLRSKLIEGGSRQRQYHETADSDGLGVQVMY